MGQFLMLTYILVCQIFTRNKNYSV